ncbi:hypothetical protein D1872_200270 [compost metagenome]
MLLHDVPRDRQAKARSAVAFSSSVAANECVEDAVPQMVGDANAVVGCFDADHLVPIRKR